MRRHWRGSRAPPRPSAGPDFGPGCRARSQGRRRRARARCGTATAPHDGRLLQARSGAARARRDRGVVVTRRHAALLGLTTGPVLGPDVRTVGGARARVARSPRRCAHSAPECRAWLRRVRRPWRDIRGGGGAPRLALGGGPRGRLGALSHGGAEAVASPAGPRLVGAARRVWRVARPAARELRWRGWRPAAGSRRGAARATGGTLLRRRRGPGVASGAATGRKQLGAEALRPPGSLRSQVQAHGGSGADGPRNLRAARPAGNHGPRHTIGELGDSWRVEQGCGRPLYCRACTSRRADGGRPPDALRPR